MPQKPSFRVKVSTKQQENVPVPLPVMTSFALPGTVAESKLQRKLQQESSFYRSHIQKTSLATWDLNTSISSLPNQSSTVFTHGMPTPQTPLTLLEKGHMMETDGYLETANCAWEDTLPMTQASTHCQPQPLRSPISLSRIPLKARTPCEFEAAEALLGLWMPIEDSKIQSPAPTDFGLTAHSIPLLPLFIPEDDLPGQAGPWDCDFQSSRVHIPRLRKGRTSKVESMLTALEGLHEARISVMDLILSILGGEFPEFSSHRLAFLGDNSRIQKILDIIWKEKSSRPAMECWVQSGGIDYICQLVSNEMESAKPMLRMKVKDVSSTYIEGWDISTIMDPVTKMTPTWTKILHAASEPRKPQSAENARNRPIARNIISASVHYLRSLASCKVQIGLGLFAWTTGASRRMIDVLHQSGLSLSYVTIAHIIDALAEHSLEEARKVVRNSPHGLAYDNINFSTSIFVEQTANTPNKVQSGTFPVMYELLNAKPEDMKLEPIITRLKDSSPLKMSDLRPSKKSVESFITQSAINVAITLLKHVKGFSYLKNEPLLRHPEQRALSKGHKTKYYCLRASTIEEASIQGNILVHDDVYRVQLRLDADDPIINTQAIPTINDQLTNARIRGAQALRAQDVSLWEQRRIFQISFGVFHLVMNFIWALLQNHRGTTNDIGSLSYFFLILEKTRLGGEHPDYHTLLSALMQVIEGLVLNAWRSECGALEDYAKSKPSPVDILQKARIILNKYANPDCKQEFSNPPKEMKPSNPAPRPDTNATPDFDTVHANTVLLTRDLLYVAELLQAISAGDFGRVEDILPDLACMFHGAGSNNYSTEILHLLFNMKEVWTPAFANIIRDNMLVNPSGLEGHAMPMDINIEHLIGDLKELFAAKGIYANWDRLGNISACVNHLQCIKKQVCKSVKTSYQGSTHADADTSSLVWRVADKARELELQTRLATRDGIMPKPTTDLRNIGRHKFESSSLATFNKKIRDLKAGNPTEGEADDISIPNFRDITATTDID